MYTHCILNISLFCALAGCTSHKTVHPEIDLCTVPVYSSNKWLKKRAHTGCTPPKIVHPVVEMYAPGAGCTLNFGHWQCSKLNVHSVAGAHIFTAGCTFLEGVRLEQLLMQHNYFKSPKSAKRFATTRFYCSDIYTLITVESKYKNVSFFSVLQ